jgi:hypothetical protein
MRDGSSYLGDFLATAAFLGVKDKEDLMTRLGSPLLKLTAVAATVTLASVGLAVAGVGLPSLPGHHDRGASHANESSNSSDVRTVIESTPPSERGCVFGHAVATAARGSELPSQAQAACTRGNHESDASETARRHTSTNTDVDSSAGRQFGQDTAQRAKGQRTATPEERQQFGQDTAQGAQGLGANPNAAAGPQGGPATGETQSQAGRSTGEQASGGHAH